MRRGEVAAHPATDYPGLRHDGVRRVDHLEAGVHNNPKRIPGAHRVRVHVPSGTVRSTYHLVHSWAIITIASGAGGVVAGILTARGFR